MPTHCKQNLFGFPSLGLCTLWHMGTLAKRIRECLDESGHTITELARFVGVKGPSIYDWLNGRTKRLSGMNLLKTAEFFGVSVDWIDSGKLPKRNIPISKHQPQGEELVNYRIKKDNNGPPELTLEAIDVAQAFMALPPERQQAYKDFLYVEMVARKLLPWLNPDTTSSTAFAAFDARIDEEVAMLAASRQKKK